MSTNVEGLHCTSHSLSNQVNILSFKGPSWGGKRGVLQNKDFIHVKNHLSTFDNVKQDFFKLYNAKTKNLDTTSKRNLILANAKKWKWQIIQCCFLKRIFINKNGTDRCKPKIKPNLNLASSPDIKTALNLSKMWYPTWQAWEISLVHI